MMSWEVEQIYLRVLKFGYEVEAVNKLYEGEYEVVLSLPCNRQSLTRVHLKLSPREK